MLNGHTPPFGGALVFAKILAYVELLTLDPKLHARGIEFKAVGDPVSVMPLDTFVSESAWRMEVVGAPDAEQPIFAAFRDLLEQREGPDMHLAALERFAFYERAKTAFAIVATGEARLYGNIILKKGIIRPL